MQFCYTLREYLDGLPVDFDGLQGEVHPDRAAVSFRVRTIAEPLKETGLAYTGVPNQNDLEEKVAITVASWRERL